jgi:hypothetical protein
MFPGHPIFIAALLFHHHYQRVPLIATHIKSSCNKNRGAVRTQARSKVVLESYCTRVCPIGQVPSGLRWTLAS